MWKTNLKSTEFFNLLIFHLYTSKVTIFHYHMENYIIPLRIIKSLSQEWKKIEEKCKKPWIWEMDKVGNNYSF